MRTRTLPEIVTPGDRERLEAWETRTKQRAAGYENKMFVLSVRLEKGWAESVKLFGNRKIEIFLGLI